ncbi:MAG: hypothetical protein HRU20_02065 [Pseudomonadales bacterium]|nr:hypothetical protein [Pseudomonadales bacterium]
MRIFMSLSLLFSLLYGPLLVQAESHNWQLSRDEDNIRSYKSRRAGQKLVAFKSDSIIDQPIAKVLTVLLDSTYAHEWIPKLKTSEIREAKHWPEAYLQFTHINAPWPVWDRIFLSRVTVDVDPISHQTNIHYVKADEDIHIAKTILGSVDGSFYQLQSVDNGQKTRLIAISVANPNGSLPKWLVNWVSANMPHDTVVLLRDYMANHAITVDARIQRLYAQPQPVNQTITSN